MFAQEEIYRFMYENDPRKLIYETKEKAGRLFAVREQYIHSKSYTSV